MLIEICTDNLQDVITAAHNGADRIELNSALALGGLTPSAGLLKLAVEHVNLPIIAMLRPRFGGFYYTDIEYKTMLKNGEEALESGAQGLAVGFLNPDYTLNSSRIKDFRKRFPKCQLVFHRAFDLTPNLVESMILLADLGFDRILTSGGEKTVWAGIDKLRELISLANGKIEILPGSGIRPDNVQKIIEHSRCNQIHATLTKINPSMTDLNKTKLNFNDVSSIEHSNIKTLSKEDLIAIRKLI